MGNYSPRAIFERTPAELATTIRSVLLAAIAVGLLNAIDNQALGAILLAVELVLGTFVIRATTSAKHPTVEQGTEVAMKGTTDTVVVQKAPPGAVTLEDGTTPVEGAPVGPGPGGGPG